MEIKDLIEVLVEQNNTYKETLFWAVTSIITLLVIFLTANFFTMRKVRNDEMEKIKSEVLLDIKNNSIPLLEKDLNDKLDLIIEGKLKLMDILDGRINMINSDLEKQVKILSEKNIEVKGELYSLQGDFMYKEEIYNTAFNDYLKAGKNFIISTPGYTASNLNDIEKTAKKLPYTLNELMEFNRFANELGPEFQMQARRIADILKEIKHL